MSATLLADYEPNSPEWHELRASGIGASEIAVVAGLSPYQSAFHLWHVKAGNIPTEADKPVFKWGHLLEPVIADEFQARHEGYAVITSGTYIGQPWQLANPDRLLYDDRDGSLAAVLEIKSSRFGDGYGKDQTSEIPVHVRCQVMQQMDVLEVDTAWVAVLIGGNEYREFVIDYDAEDAAALREAGEAFWLSLQLDDEPPIDTSDSTYQAIRQLHPDIDAELEAEIPAHIWADYLTARQMSEKWSDDYRGAKSKLLDALGAARVGLFLDRPVVRRQPSSRGGVALHMIGESA